MTSRALRAPASVSNLPSRPGERADPRRWARLSQIESMKVQTLKFP